MGTLIGRSFLHAADLHLGSSWGKLGGQIQEFTTNQKMRLAELSLKAFENLVSLAIERNVLCVVLSGDVFDREPVHETQQHFLIQMERLQKRDIRVFMVHGNHDPNYGTQLWFNLLPKNVTVFQPLRDGIAPEDFEIEADDTITISVSGLSYAQQKEFRDLVSHFNLLDSQPNNIRIGLLHTNLDSGAKGHHPYAPSTQSQLSNAPVNYWALGHIHKREYFQFDSRNWAVYPGNIQGRHFKNSECEPKGAVLVTIKSDYSLSPDFCSLDEIRFVTRDVDVSDIRDQKTFKECLDKEIKDIVDLELFTMTQIRLTGRNDRVSDIVVWSQNFAAEATKKNDEHLYLAPINCDSISLEIDIEEVIENGGLLADIVEGIRKLTDQEILAIIKSICPVPEYSALLSFQDFEILDPDINVDSQLIDIEQIRNDLVTIALREFSEGKNT